MKKIIIIFIVVGIVIGATGIFISAPWKGRQVVDEHYYSIKIEIQPINQNENYTVILPLPILYSSSIPGNMTIDTFETLGDVKAEVIDWDINESVNLKKALKIVGKGDITLKIDGRDMEYPRFYITLRDNNSSIYRPYTTFHYIWASQEILLDYHINSHSEEKWLCRTPFSTSGGTTSYHFNNKDKTIQKDLNSILFEERTTVGDSFCGRLR